MNQVVKRQRDEPVGDSSYVVQANSMAQAPYVNDVDLHALRIITVAMAKVTQNPDLFDEVVVDYRDLKEIFPGYRETNKVPGYMRSVVGSIRSAHMIVDTPGHSYKETNLCQDAEYIEGRGRLVIRFHSDMRRLLLNLALGGRFTRYQLASIVKLTADTQIHLFHFLRSFAYKGEVTADLDVVRRRIGVRESAYPEWYDLRKRVLDPAIRAINANSDISVVMKPKGRPVSRLEFLITTKTKSRRDFEPVEIGVVNYLKSLGVGATAAEEIVRSMVPIEVATRTGYFSLVLKKNGDNPRTAVREPAAFLTALLRSSEPIDSASVDGKSLRDETVRVIREIRQSVFDSLSMQDQLSLQQQFMQGLTEAQRLIYESAPNEPAGILGAKWRAYLDGVIMPEGASVQFVVGDPGSSKTGSGSAGGRRGRSGKSATSLA